MGKTRAWDITEYALCEFCFLIWLFFAFVNIVKHLLLIFVRKWSQEMHFKCMILPGVNSTVSRLNTCDCITWRQMLLVGVNRSRTASLGSVMNNESNPLVIYSMINIFTSPGTTFRLVDHRYKVWGVWKTLVSFISNIITHTFDCMAVHCNGQGCGQQKYTNQVTHSLILFITFNMKYALQYITNHSKNNK